MENVVLEKYGFVYDSSGDYDLKLPDNKGVLVINKKGGRNALLIQYDKIIALMRVQYFYQIKLIYYTITGLKLKEV